MKNLSKINPGEGITLSDGEMKDIAGGTYYGDTCQEKNPNQCNMEPCMSSSVRTGVCRNPSGNYKGCICVERFPIP